jgi:hypothetical protein
MLMCEVFPCTNSTVTLFLQMNEAYSYLCTQLPLSGKGLQDIARDWLHAKLVYHPTDKIDDGIAVLHSEGFMPYVVEWEYYKRVIGRNQTTFWTSLFSSGSDWGVYERSHSVTQVGTVLRDLPLLSSLKTVKWIYTDEMAKTLQRLDNIATRRVEFYLDLARLDKEVDVLLAMCGKFLVKVDEKTTKMHPRYEKALSALGDMIFTSVEEIRADPVPTQVVKMEDKPLQYRFMDSISLWGLIFRSKPSVTTDTTTETKEAKAASPPTLVSLRSDLAIVGEFIATVLPDEWASFYSLLARLHMHKAGAISKINSQTVAAIAAKSTASAPETKREEEVVDEFDTNGGDKIARLLARLYRQALKKLELGTKETVVRYQQMRLVSHMIWQCIKDDKKVNTLFNGFVASELAQTIVKDLDRVRKVVDKEVSLQVINKLVKRDDTDCSKTACRFLDLLTFQKMARKLGLSV